jgi:hypothetical protein
MAVGSGAALIQLGLGLAVIIGGLAWTRRRVHGPRTSTRLVRLTPQDAVHVVEIDGRRLLVGTGAGGSPRLLCELGPAVSAASGFPVDPQIPGLRAGARTDA